MKGSTGLPQVSQVQMLWKDQGAWVCRWLETDGVHY